MKIDMCGKVILESGKNKRSRRGMKMKVEKNSQGLKI
jgi:hypothetical protein